MTSLLFYGLTPSTQLYVGQPAADTYFNLQTKATMPPQADLPAAYATNYTTLFRAAGASEAISYDDAGNIQTDGRWVYTWDALNRLRCVESKSTAPAESKRKLEFQYDVFGRRIQRTINVWTNDSYRVTDKRKFVYDGWYLVAELNATNNQAIRSYTWAQDQLVEIRQNYVSYVPVYDANRNVTALVNRNNSTIAAHYEHGPYGLIVKASGPMALENPFRYSSEYQDPITGFIYYGFRYFNPATQRWLSPDPIGMAGGYNLYGFVNNDPINNRDRLGLEVDSSGGAGQLLFGFVKPIASGLWSLGLGIAHEVIEDPVVVPTSPLGTGDVYYISPSEALSVWFQQHPPALFKPPPEPYDFSRFSRDILLTPAQREWACLTPEQKARERARAKEEILAPLAMFPLRWLAVRGWPASSPRSLVLVDEAAGIETAAAGPCKIVAAKGAQVEQYALRAADSGFYPVMVRGAKEPQFITYLERGDVWKFGTTKNPATRYSQSYLDSIGEHGVQYSTEFQGTLQEAVTLQNMKIQNFRLQTGQLPPGNKIVN